jgi:hypothetical protein
MRGAVMMFAKMKVLKLFLVFFVISLFFLAIATLVQADTTQLSNTFAPSQDGWDYFSFANYNKKQECIELVNSKNKHSVGVIWLKKQIPLPFSAEFKYLTREGSGSVGDGICFMFCKDKNYTPSGGGAWDEVFKRLCIDLIAIKNKPF